MRFDYSLPVNLVFGCGRIAELGGHTARYGKRALLVTGKSSAKASGLLDRCLALLDAAGVSSVVFSDIEANPLSTTAYRGAAMAQVHKCDVVIGLGGGSAMDSAKAIAFCAKNSGDVWDYIFGRETGNEALPIVLVPTTAGTGSEGNCFAVLTNPENGDKKSLRTPLIFAKSSIIDPDLLGTLSPRNLATAGFDAVTHCVEAILSTRAQPLTDLLAFEGLTLLSQSLVPVCGGRASGLDWAQVSWGATLGGMVISTAGVGAAHALEHPASGRHPDLAHGLGLAALYPAVMRFCSTGISAGNGEKLARISRLFGGTGASDAAAALEALLESLCLRVNLCDLGIVPGDIDWMVENCLKVSAASLENSPRPLSPVDIRRLYEESLGDGASDPEAQSLPA